ncbi:MAG: glycosyltransferase [Paludibacter sp.]|nr:glycosyltransferase [Paludibacter sp.]
MNKIYIIYYEWANTVNNHAGMAYLAQKIKDKYPENIRLFKHIHRFDFNYWLRKLYIVYSPIYSFLLSIYIYLTIKENDIVLFLEYENHLPGNEQYIARILRRMGLENKFIALIHHPEKVLKKMFTELQIIDDLSYVDKVLCFGSSLKKYLSQLKKSTDIIQTYHYVDIDFYSPTKVDNYENKERLKVICIGNQLRNYKLLYNVARLCSEIDFIICKGLNKDMEFDGLNNVKSFGYLNEQSLLDLMCSCDISLNIMNDTVGSNVIVTSLACGLAIVSSDVGSIRDYCNETNSILCPNNDYSFQKALLFLNGNRDVCNSMKISCRETALNISLEKFLNNEFPDILDK